MFKRTIGDLATFSAMFVLMILMFTLLSINLGVDNTTASTETGDYPNVNGFFHQPQLSMQIHGNKICLCVLNEFQKLRMT